MFTDIIIHAKASSVRVMSVIIMPDNVFLIGTLVHPEYDRNRINENVIPSSNSTSLKAFLEHTDIKLLNRCLCDILTYL